MKIWIVQPFEVTPLDNKGNQRLMRIGILSEILVKRGHEVLLWTSDFDHKNKIHRNNSNKKIKIKSNYSIQFIKSLGYKKNISLQRIVDHILLANNFKSLIEREMSHPDIILASFPIPILASKAVFFANKFNIPIIVDIRDLWPDVFLEYLPKFFKNFSFLIDLLYTNRAKKIFKNTTAITGITKPFVEWGLSKGGRERSYLDKVFHLGYVTQKLNKKGYQEALDFWEEFNITKNSDYFYVCYLGNLSPLYSFTTIVEAAKMASKNKLKIKFILCGKGSKLNKLKKISEDINNLIIPGYIYKNQIKTILDLSHLGLVPYKNLYSFLNTISNKSAEYLSASLPIALSINNGLLYEKLKAHKAGFSYSENPEKLINNILQIKDNPEKLSSFQANAYKYYKSELDGEKVYNDFANYLEDLSNK